LKAIKTIAPRRAELTENEVSAKRKQAGCLYGNPPDLVEYDN